MTEPIMIDGVDVSGCEYFFDRVCMCSGKLTAYGSCVKNPNCYYKQLQRKTAECESLKELLRIRADETNKIWDKLQIATEALDRIFSNSVNCDGMDCCYCNDKHCNTYIAKKALERIKE